MEYDPYQPPSAQTSEVGAGRSLDVTFSRATKVWWSLAWRAVLFGVLAGMAAGFVIGVIAVAAHVPRERMSTLGGVTGLAVGIPVGILVVQMVLRKSWSDFRIVLVPTINEGIHYR